MTSEKLYNLTHPQLGIWNIELFHQNTPVNNIVGSVKYEKDMDIDLLEKSINILIQKNDAFRIRIIEKEGQPLQYIKEYEYEKIRIMDFTGYTDEKEEETINKEVQKPFNIMDSKLYDFAILMYNDGSKGFYINAHHMITDAMSMAHIGSRITEIYVIISSDDEKQEILYPRYTEFIEKQTEYKISKRFDKDKEYWSKKFETFPEFTELKNYNTEKVSLKSGRNIYKVPRHLTKAFHHYCKTHGVTPYTFLMSTLVAYLARITQKEDITIGTPILNRNGRKERDTFGMFISVSPLRVNVNQETSFIEHTKNIEAEIKGLLMHQAYPYDLILSDFRNTHQTSDQLYDLVFSYQNAKFEIPEELPYETKWWANGHDTNSVTIHVSDRESDGRLIVEIDYLKQLFNSEEIDSIFKHMFNLLAYAILHSEKKVYELEILTTAEKNELLYKFNDTYADYPRDKVIHELFEEQAEKTPDNIALVFEEQQMTYRELNEKANQLARVLREKGVGPDKLVGIMVHRSLEMIVGIFAVLKAGGAYVPIDPEYPEERIKYMLSDANVSILLTQNILENKVEYTGEKIFVELDNEVLYNRDNFNLDIINKPNDLVYVIYTSGSTGQPKGVMIEHKGLVNYIKWANKVYIRNEQTDFPLYSSFAFDLTITSIFTPLISGNKIYIYEDKESKMLIKKVFEEDKVQIIKLTPAHMTYLLTLDTKIKNIKKLIVGGEDLKSELCKNFQNKFRTDVEIYNEYGPTETVVGCMIHKYDIKIDKAKSVPIGIPSDNVKLYILDKNKKILPKNTKGELYIESEGVTRGYKNKLNITNQKITINPYTNYTSYRSGDVVLMNNNLEIEYIERKDTQVKINGMRIELSEIEKAIINEGIIEVKALVKNNKIIIFFTSDRNMDGEIIKKHLKKKLPIYMIPSKIIKIEKMPLTINGKIDDKSLQQMKTDKVSKRIIKSKNKIESKIIKIWEKVMNKKNIGTNNDIYDLGADSIDIMKFLTISVKNNWSIKVQDFYDYPTIKELAKKISNNSKKSKNYTKDRIIKISKNTIKSLEIKKQEVKEILLVGSTGFLGAHILEKLLNNITGTVCCIVRVSNEITGKGRLFKMLEYYFGNEKATQMINRVVVIEGDITKEHLGIKDEEYRKLIESIDTIVNCSGNVKHYGNYKDFHKANVEGVKNLIDISKKGNKKLVQTSTISVSGDYLVGHKLYKKLFTENDLYIGQEYKENPYIRTKYEAEELILKEVKKGLNAQIIRTGNIIWRNSDKKFQINPENSALYTRMKYIKAVMELPKKLAAKRLKTIHVDQCADQIAKILNTTSEQKVFHIYDNEKTTMKELLEEYYGQKIRLKNTTEQEFIRKAITNINENDNEDSNIIADIKDDHVLKENNIRISNKLTREYLKGII
ncbi:MAG TPA: hypothetical protein DEP72_07555 [Clostridiales bacterium]|nr:MAG: hypothetical protein A2Y18_07080 [Clostridiales bacterium GWD2_32_19]HCC07991.1 hypothetical protein [Clostridiales bacterium]